MRTKNFKKAFTLIELLVVISIIGVLSTLSIVSLNSARMKARDVKRMSDVKSIDLAITRFVLDNNHIPINGAPSLNCGDDEVLHMDGVICSINGLSNYSGTEYINPYPKPLDGEYYSFGEDYYASGSHYVISQFIEAPNTERTFTCFAGDCRFGDATWCIH